VLVSEIGIDMSRFETAAPPQLAGLCPRQRRERRQASIREDEKGCALAEKPL